jgi:L-threonylcarbamoyladenylate synthase
MDPPLGAALRALAAGRVVGYPTDTLYGLAARASDRAAVGRVYAAKRRPPDQPLSVAVSSWEEVEAIARPGPAARAFLREHLPGPYTVLLPPSPRPPLAPELLLGGSVGVRIPDHPLARELARLAGPITATSANRHGARAPSSAAGARAQLGEEVALYLSGGPAPSGRPSTLVDCTRERPVALDR